MNTKLGEQYPVAKKKKTKKKSEQRVTSIISVANYLSNQKYNKILKNDWLSPNQFEFP